MNLTAEQSAILKNQEGSFRIIAAAGSGKTTTLTLYIKEAIDGGLKGEEIIFITFTRLASFDIKSKVHSLIGSKNKLCCGTFHSVMFRLMRDAGLAMPNPIHLFDGCMERNVDFVLEQLRAPTVALLTLLRSYRLLVVDEFQDLDPHQFEFIALFKRIQPTLRIIAIGDMAQNIYRFRGTSNEFLRRLLQSEIVPDLGTFTLSTNFRSSATILAAVNAIFQEEIRSGHVLPMVPARAAGVKPRYYEYVRTEDKGIGAYEEAVVRTLVPILIDAKAHDKSVALIFPVIKCQSYETILALLSSALRDLDFHRIAKEDATSSVVEITYDAHERRAPVQLSTFHASKGLEWDVVALINVSDDIYQLKPGEVDDEGFYAEKTNLLYVGLTRAVEKLFVFANANRGGRHRLLSRLGADLGAVLEIEVWGEEEVEPLTDRLPGPVSVTDLVRRVMQHPDVYARITACSEHIAASFHRGEPLSHDEIYAEMKQRNRELAFGTFIDRMVKRTLTREPTLQCRILELLSYMSSTNWFHKDHAKASIEVLSATIDQFFERAGNLPNADVTAYITAARIIAAFKARLFNMTDALGGLYGAAERAILRTYKKDTLSIRDEYLLSHTYNLYARSQLNEIRAVDARENSYQGLPAGFDEFATASVVPAAAIIRLASSGSGSAEFRADIPVESESLIHGEIDMMTTDTILEIKCGAATDVADLRGSASCSNLLQLLAYVALGRHGSLPLSSASSLSSAPSLSSASSRSEVKWALLINPLTATWERYDLSTWRPEQSLEFMECLMELQRRG
jgi:hypothetical protein